nr:S-layer homology domain-containing protein [Lysinibacillus timonensis]
MTKKQYKQFLNTAIAATVVASGAAIAMPTTADASEKFSDIKVTDNFYNAVMSLKERNIVNGFPDGTYGPHKSITRGQVAVILSNALGLDTENVTNPEFEDVSTDHPYYKYIAALENAGYVNGYEDDTFKPGESINRYHMALILKKAYNLTATDVDALPFTDVYEGYKESIAALYENGVTAGKTATTFNGLDNVTRSQMALFIVAAEKAVNPTITISKIADNKVVSTEGEFTFAPEVAGIFAEANETALKNAEMQVKVEAGQIVEVQSLTLNSAGTADTPVVFNGSAAKVGSLTINADHVEVNNLEVAGNITVTDSVSTQTKLIQVKSNGELIVEESVEPVAALSFFSLMAATEEAGPTITLEQSSVQGVQAKRNNVAFVSDTNLRQITVAPSVSTIKVDSKVDRVVVDGALAISGNATIGEISVEKADDVSVNINGKVRNLVVKDQTAKVALGADTKVEAVKVPVDADSTKIISNYDQVKENITSIVDNEGKEIDALTDEEAYEILLTEIANASTGDTVELRRDITVSEPLVIDKAITLEGNGHKLLINTGSDDWSNTLKSLFVSADATIQNVIIENGELTNDNLVEVQNANVTLNNVEVNGSKRAGIALLAGGTMTLEGEITLNGNAWGGIDVSKEGSHLTIAEGAIINYDGAKKANGQVTPIVYIDNAAKNIDPTVYVTDNADVLPEAVYVLKGKDEAGVETNDISTKEEANFVWFGGTPISEEDAIEKFLGDIEAAEAGDTVELARDITLTQPLAIDKAITVDGNGFAVTVETGKDDWSNTLKSVFVSADATLKDIAIVNGEATDDNLIEVQAANVTLENVTVEGSKRAGIAILKDGNVTLEGTTTLSNNAWGGIDVSKEGSHLTVAEGAEIQYDGAVKANGQVTPIVYIDNAEKNIDPANYVTDNAAILPEAVHVVKGGASGTETESNDRGTLEESNFVWFGGELVTNEYLVNQLEFDIANAEAGETVELVADITISEPLSIDNEITLDGNGRTITVATGADDYSNTLKSVFISADATLQDVDIVNGEGTDDNLIEVQNADVTLENVSVEGSKRAGIAILAGGTVTLEGQTELVDNAWGGIDVSKEGSHLTIAEGATIAYTGAVKENGQTTPIIYIDNEAGNIDPTVYVTDLSDEFEAEAVHVLKVVKDGVETNVAALKEEANFVWFGGTPTITAEYAKAKFLNDLALATSGDTVSLVGDMTLTEPLTIDEAIVIEGNDHIITVNTGADTYSNTLKSLYISADATLRNVKVVSGELTNDNLIEVENANVLLENVTVQDSKRAGIAVLAGGHVTLKGEITLANNAWGGIDVSKEGSHLTVVEGSRVIYTGAVKANGQVTPIVYIDNAAKNIDPAVYVTDPGNVLPAPVYVLKVVDSTNNVELNVVSTKEEANFVWFGGTPSVIVEETVTEETNAPETTEVPETESTQQVTE